MNVVMVHHGRLGEPGRPITAIKSTTQYTTSAAGTEWCREAVTSAEQQASIHALYSLNLKQ